MTEREKIVKIQDIEQAEAELAKYVPLVSQLPGEQMTLERIKPLMQLLDNPQDKLKVIHVAGTSGKTSTAYYLTALLSKGGKKIGLTVSPHINTVRERVQINLKPISEKDFCNYLGAFLDVVNELQTQPTYFELLYAFAIWVFEQEKVDYAVIETGMGGLYDATNVVTSPDKICIITDIGLDHTHILGDTIEKIAMQKAGIIHQGNEVFMLQQSQKVNMLIKEHCLSKNAKYHLLHPPTTMSHISLTGFKLRNFFLANKVLNFIQNRDKLPNLTSQAKSEAANTSVPARMEILTVSDKHFVIDGAHNIQKLEAFISAYKADYPTKKPVIIFALKDGKDFEPFVNRLTELGSEIVATTFYTTQDLPVKSIDADKITARYPTGKIAAISDHDELIEYVKNSSSRDFVITGSFYLISQLKPKLIAALI